MKSNIHYKFITTPISEILEEAVSACKGIGNGIETQPLCEYIMQTTFLKMTGASEQKLKCICWEMATYDFEYRYQTLNKQVGELSSLEDKKSIFKDIQQVIIRIVGRNNFPEMFIEEEKVMMISTIHNKIISTIENSLLSILDNKSFLKFKHNPMIITTDDFANKNIDKNAKVPYILFNNNLAEYYEKTIYRHRNRCAHNLKSYQENLPSLKKLQSKDYDNENYFQMFFVLMLMDEIYMLMYKKYVQLLNENIF